MKDHGQVGVDGDHAQQVVVKAPRYAHVSTVVGHHAQGVQQTQGTVKVSLNIHYDNMTISDPLNTLS